ncbi:MAG TPA: A/G-specific adenine glycosylase, partial [Thermoanaerobaculia bacterium]|nr:A/G-specific adenine glycosylase [Thermoanaerobaculia bacterium]
MQATDLPRLARRIESWFAKHQRPLPWRKRYAPYHVWVSEVMLQQTRMEVVLPYFARFVKRFPTLRALAEATEQDVMAAWSGLGYYRRARMLHAAARAANGVVPRTLDALMALPGVGRYTAGAIASIAYNERAPIVDGNVARVLCRIDKIESDPREKATLARLWQRAEEILPRKEVGDFNSAMMELGATVCTPRNPQCLICPVRAFCEAQAAGLQEQIPVRRKSKINPLHRRAILCIEHTGQWLIEQRPPMGRWAGM